MKFSDDQVIQLNQIFDAKLQPIKTDIALLKTDVALLKKAVKPIKSIQRTVNSMKKDLNWVIGKYDTRLNHLEKHVTHPPSRTADI